MTAPIGSEALIPNPALKPFERFVGEWQTTGTHPLVPGKLFHGRASFAWQDGGAFLVLRTEVDEPEIPSGIAIFGSDDEAGRYFMIYFDERGVSRKYDVSIDDGAFSWQRQSPKLAQRMVCVGDPASGRMVLRGEMSQNGGDWEGDLETTYERIGPNG